tara:strand:- start:581 stop:730 length:150 start_codon:yes stop_codon:yes gene_type:complete
VDYNSFYFIAPQGRIELLTYLLPKVSNYIFEAKNLKFRVLFKKNYFNYN